MADKNFSSDQFVRQLEYLGYSQEEEVFLREFAGKNSKADDFRKAGIESKDFFKGVKPSVSRTQVSRVAEKEIWKQNQQRGLYFVVNGQGDKDSNVKYGKAIFIEHDHKEGLTRQEQIDLWKKLNLPEPTFQIESRNGIQQYWSSTEQIGLDDWKELQEDLIALTGSDPKNKNPSRVFRVAGSYHVQKDIDGNLLPDFQCNIINESGVRYNYDQLRAAIPSRKASLPVFNANEFAGQEVQHRAPKESNSGPVPLVNLLSISHRDVLTNGIGEGGRNNGLAEFVRDAIGVENWLLNQGYQYEGNARQLLDQANSRCSPCLEEREVDTIWVSAERSNPTPCLDQDKLQNCLDAWIKPSTYKQAQNSTIENPVTVAAANIFTANKIYSVNGRLAKKIKFKSKKEDEDKELYEYLTDFDFDVIDIFGDTHGLGNSGVLLKVKQVGNEDAKDREVLILDRDLKSLADFCSALRTKFGYTLAIDLKIGQINQIIGDKIEAYIKRGGERHLLAPLRGRQPNGYWVFEDIQFDPKGEVCKPKQSTMVFNANQDDGDAIPSPKILKPNPEALGKVLTLAREYVGNTNIFPTLFVIAGQVMGVHYHAIRDNGYTIFPFVNATGDPGTGKSTAASIAQALVGMHESGFGDTSHSAIMQRLKILSGISLNWDDPKKDKTLDECLKSIASGEARIRRGNVQTPQSSVIVTSNHFIGEDKAAVESRSVAISFFKTNDINDNLRLKLKTALKTASAAFSTLIKFGFDAEEVNNLALKLKPELKKSHSRTQDNLALITFYALKLAPYAGLTSEQIMDYVINVLCPAANQSESNKPSHLDLVEKLEILANRSLIGDWNYRVIEKNNYLGVKQKAVSFKLESIWNILINNFDVSYSKKVILNLIKQSGNNISDVQHFAKDQREWQAWQIRQNDKDVVERNPQPERKSYRCVTIFIDNEPDVEPEPTPQPVKKVEPEPVIEPTVKVVQSEIAPVAIAEPKVVEQVVVIDEELENKIYDYLDCLTTTQEYKEFLRIWASSGDPVKEKAAKSAWQKLPDFVILRLKALTQREDVEQLKMLPPFNQPDWCPYQAGELIVDKNNNLFYVKNYIKPTDKDVPRSVAEGRYLWIVPINKKINNGMERHIPIDEVRAWSA